MVDLHVETKLDDCWLAFLQLYNYISYNTLKGLLFLLSRLGINALNAE
jgi:hypothetical protein